MSKLITIIEDDPKNLVLFRDVLEVNGYTTNEALNGRLGVELVRKSQPDLVLMDIQMPEMDGLEATRILKADAKTRHIPILALSSYAMTGDRERILSAGCDGYLSKPINVGEFLKTVADYLVSSGDARHQ